ncbi:hypothetical protein ACFSL6_17520 [Paenibacillus thailandensis]|uniref:Uncharacterized protein n=1 Tax=Paenibacillus thailandensis TaxID=393250 RepID=A0ABW5R328_9BACL
MTQQQIEAEQSYLALYAQFLDEPDAGKRQELKLQMQEIEQVQGWIF